VVARRAWRLPAGTAALGHDGEADDDFSGSGARRSDTGAAGHAFVARAWRVAVSARPGNPARRVALQVEMAL
jgi:hypothetical protein